VLLAVAIATSFLTSMTLLPTLVKVFRPRFMTGKETRSPPTQTLGEAS